MSEFHLALVLGASLWFSVHFEAGNSTPHVTQGLIGNRFGFVTKMGLSAKKLTATPMTQVIRKSLFRKMLERFLSR